MSASDITTAGAGTMLVAVALCANLSPPQNTLRRLRDSHSSGRTRDDAAGVYTGPSGGWRGRPRNSRGTSEEHCRRHPQNWQNHATRLRHESPVNRHFRRDATSMVRKGRLLRWRTIALDRVGRSHWTVSFYRCRECARRGLTNDRPQFVSACVARADYGAGRSRAQESDARSP
jgi:hypothetical protein